MTTTDTDPLADVKVGDPIPDEIANDLDSDACEAPTPGKDCEDKPQTFVCSRPYGHVGQHLACTDERVVGATPQAGTS